MTSNQYKYFSQKKFHGGIETRQEFIEDNQLLDARNHWAPLGEMEQRPGSLPRKIATVGTATLVAATTTVWSDVSTATDFLLTNGDVLTNIAFGDVITFHSSTAPSAVQVISSIILPTNTVANAVSKTRAQIEMWTARGWIGINQETVKGTTQDLFPFAPSTNTGGSNWQQQIVFASPADLSSTTLTFTTGSYTGYFIRFRLVSATTLTGVPFTAGVKYGNASGEAFLQYTDTSNANLVNVLQKERFPGAFFLKYGAGNLTIVLRSLGATTGGSAYTRVGTAIVAVKDSLRYNSITENNRYDSRFAVPNPYPPSVAVIPEFNTAFIAYCNLVLEVPYGGPYTQTDSYPPATTDTGPLVARINTDPLIVGPVTVENPTVPYSSDLIPQLTAFPAANLIVYFRNQLFCSGIQGIGNLIRWSGSSTDFAYNVWPEDNQVTLSTARDNSEITAIAPLGDNLVVFKKNSIWQMIDNGDSDVGTILYEPRLVVAGVGAVAHQSVQAVQGGLIFLAEDGFYFYDGTPNIKRISDPIQPYIDRINPARSPFAVATVWRSKQAYMCAVSLDSETQANDFVFVYDYQNGAWWVWDGWDVQCWLQIDGVGLKEEVYYLDGAGRAFKLGAWTQSDNGAEIDSWFLTPRFGFDDAITKTALELRVRGINNNPTVNYNVIGDDVEINVTGSTTVDPLTLPITMAGVDEAQYDNDEVYGGAVYAPTRRRERKSANRTTASWFQIRIRKMLKVFGWDLGYEPEGRR